MSRPDDSAGEAAARLAGLGLAGAASAVGPTHDADEVPSGWSSGWVSSGWVPEQPASIVAPPATRSAPPGAVAMPGIATPPPSPARSRSTAPQRRAARPSPAGIPLPAAWSDRLPVWLQSAVAAPSTAALGWLAAVCAVCLAVTAYVVLHGRSTPPATDYSAPLPATTAATSSSVGSPAVSAGSIVVDVGGRVRHPGLVTLPTGARVADAVRAAGGALHRRDLLTVNLAARVTDGQLLLIGLPDAAAASAATGSSPAPVDLNTATADQLDTLPGIGPVLAQRIIDWRTAHGGFRQVGDLREVSGIGDSTYADLAPLVSV